MEVPEGQPQAAFALPSNLAPLGYRNFALFWLGFVTTNTGKNIELIGTVWLVSTLTDSPLLLGLLGIVRAIPAIILGPISGVVVDRVDHRRLLLVTQTLSLVASLALGLLIASGAVELWMVYVQVAIQSAIMAFDASVRQTLFPSLVPKAMIPEAVTLTMAAGRISSMVGPVIGGIAIATWGEAAPFFLNAATFLALMAAVLLMKGILPRVVTVSASFRGDLVEGLRYLSSMPVLSGLLKMELVFSLFQVNAVLVTIIARDVLGVGPEGLGFLLAADALGAVVGIAGLLLIGQPRRQGRFNIFCTFAYGAALLVFAASSSFALSFIALGVTGVMDVLMTVTRNQILLTATPVRMRGRVMGNLGTITRGIGPIAQTQSGVLAALVGGPLAVVGAAVVLVANAVATARLNPTLWGFSRSDEP